MKTFFLTNKNQLPITCDYIALTLFSVVVALGAWNPFSHSYMTRETENNSLAQAVIVLFIFYLIFSLIWRNYKVKIGTSDGFIILFFFHFSITSLLLSSYSSGNKGFNEIFFLIKFLLDIILMIFLSSFFNATPKYIDYSLLCYIGTCSTISLLYIMGFLNSHVSMHSGRLYLGNENPNSTSGRFVFAVISLMYLILQNPYKWGKNRFYLTLLCIPLLAMIVGSGSRGSILILAMCIVLYISCCNYRLKKKLLLLGGVAIIVTLFYYLWYQAMASELSVFDRFQFLFNTNETSRDRLIQQTKILFWDKPLIGWGASRYKEQMLARFFETHEVHNLYYYVLATSGIIGFIPFFIFLISLFCQSYKIRGLQPFAIVFLGFIFLLYTKTGGVLTYFLCWYIFAIVSTYNTILAPKIQVQNSDFKSFNLNNIK